MALTDEEKLELKQEILDEIKASSEGADELETVDTLDGVTSLPALKDKQLVSVPIEQLRKPAEEAAELATLLAADWNVLEIRLGGAESSRAGFGLIKGRVNSAVLADNFEESVAIGRFELCELAVFEQQFNRRMGVFKRFKHLGIGRITAFGLLFSGESEVLKKGDSQLLWGIEVEGIADVVENARLNIGYALGKLLAVAADAFRVNQKAFVFHIPENTCKRDFYL